MTQLGTVAEIKSVKMHLDELKKEGLIADWEVPYEEILTRLSAATFFLTPVAEAKLGEVWKQLGTHGRLRYRLNQEKKLSPLHWRVEFDKAEVP